MASLSPAAILLTNISSDEFSAPVAARGGIAATADCGRMSMLSMEVPLVTSHRSKARTGGAVPGLFSWRSPEPTAAVGVGSDLSAVVCLVTDRRGTLRPHPVQPGGASSTWAPRRSRDRDLGHE